ncbi:molecular chaperone Hsp90 [uncultured Phascolarctobacterium sp.]|uniref:molecular chaperone Hsp90 n=1 Tax=uncultured Phascolarctobacterium sp. TaxID=512296 RepID=UPI0025DC5BDC|nr:molecular chaperone Hsp90 [uncultured Phascolarctobacterium sp.]
MKQETLNFVKEQTAALIAALSCSAEAKAAAEKWLAAVGTAEEAEATKAYVAELEADIMPIDGLIAFAGSDAGVGVFGAELAKNILAHAEEIKAAGAEYCDCPACAACKAILEKKAELL